MHGEQMTTYTPSRVESPGGRPDPDGFGRTEEVLLVSGSDRSLDEGREQEPPQGPSCVPPVSSSACSRCPSCSATFASLVLNLHVSLHASIFTTQTKLIYHVINVISCYEYNLLSYLMLLTLFTVIFCY